MYTLYMYMYNKIFHFYTCRFVFDGWPMTKAQVDLLSKYQIIPIAIAELKVSNEALLIRAETDRNSKDRYTCTVYVYMYIVRCAVQ